MRCHFTTRPKRDPLMSSGSRYIWSGSADLHRAFPVPQTGGTLPCPEPGRSPSGQPLVAYPRFLFGLVVQTDFHPSTVAEEVRGQNLVRCEGDPGILEGAPGSAPGLSGPQPLVLSYHTPPPKIGAPERSCTSVWRLSVAWSTVDLRAHGAADGTRTHVVFPGKEAPSF